MSISLTRILQQITGLNTFFAGPSASRDNGVVLLDTATVTWGTDGQGNIQATAAGGSAPTGAANLVYATPNGSSGSASLRALVTADLPALPPSGLTLIQKVTTAGGEGAVTFSAIPQTYAHLKIVVHAMGQSGTVGAIIITLNGDTSFNYSTAFMSSTQAAATTASVVASTDNSLVCGSFGSVGYPGASEITVPNYTAAAQHAVIGHGIAFQGANYLGVDGGGTYFGTAAVTGLSLGCSGSTFLAGSVISLYGMQ